MIYVAAGTCAVLLFLAIVAVSRTMEDLENYEKSKNYWKRLEGPK